MKSFLMGVAVTAPLTVVGYLYFTAGKHDVQIQQQRAEITQRLAETQFDQAFDKIADAIAPASHRDAGGIKAKQLKQAKVTKKIKDLESQQAKFDKMMLNDIQQTESDHEELKAALNDMPTLDDPALDLNIDSIGGD